MKITRKKSEKAWDERELGASKEYVRKASPEREKKLDEDLGLQTISIRLQKSLIENLKDLAKEDGIGYQPFMRQILMRYVRQIHQERKGET
jgi:predicted DNA binding CopG/RHH family protein